MEGIGGSWRTNLGFEILKRFNIIIDYPDTLIFLNPRNNFKEAFEHDMSGMEYYSVGGEFRYVFIGRVELGSAADQAGIKKDDELLAVNFKPVNTVTLDDLDQLFRSKEERKLLLGIYRNKKYENIIITLKRRI
jgi:C-terminal processing protease CtpA/Prc